MVKDLKMPSKDLKKARKKLSNGNRAGAYKKDY